MSINWQAIRKPISRIVLFDIFMLFIAIVNLSLFSFDYTYLTFRNFYYNYIPSISSYDKIKGIEPHDFTQDYLNKASDFFATSQSRVNEKLRDELINLSFKMIDEDPFKPANKSGEFEVIKSRMKLYAKIDSKDKTMRPSKKSFKVFWDISIDQLEDRKKFFYTEIAPIMQTNYWRKIDRTGNYVDYYKYIDSVFVFVFILEFLLMWQFSIKRFGEDEKVLYPVYHWYDIVSCIPLSQFRALRLIRVVFVYRRLVKRGIIIPSDNPIKRMINKYNQIITEELSAKVSLQILTDIEEKTKLGLNKTIIEETLLPHKEALKSVIIKNLQKVSVKMVDEHKGNIIDFITFITERTLVELPEYKKISKIPYVKETIDNIISRKNLSKLINSHSSNLTENLDYSLKSEVGEKFLNDLIDALIDEILLTMKDKLVQDLIEKINLQFISELKESTSFRKWKQDKLNK